MLLPYSANKASVANITPLPVAASLPRDPPRSYPSQKNLSNIKKLCKLYTQEVGEVFWNKDLYTYNRFSSNNCR